MTYMIATPASGEDRIRRLLCFVRLTLSLRKFTALKEKNPNLKTILAVGGWNEGSKSYSIMAASLSMRKTFVASSLEFLQKYNFDGLDFDWEYPNQRDTENGEADIDNFTQLLKELKEAFETYGFSSIAAGATENLASLSYDIPAISKHVDFISVMAYDFYGAFDAVTGHNAQIFPGEGDEDTPKDSLFTVENALKYWLNKGIPKEKLILGLPLYGRTFNLTDPSDNNVRAPNSGFGLAGPFTRSPGTIGYNELCNLFNTEEWDIRFDNLAKVPYAVHGRDWVSYDDPKSLAIKVEYGLSFDIGGFMVWSIETDDFHGICSGTKNPLLNTIKDGIQKKNDDPVCGSEEGLVADPEDCNSFYNCFLDTYGSIQGVSMKCPKGLHFEQTTKTCNWPQDANCKSDSSSAGAMPKPSLCGKEDSLVPNPEDCGSFYYCVGTKPVFMECPAHLYWDQDLQACNWPQYVKCHN